MADYDIGEAFSAIEDELISSMIRNLKRHKAEETAEGMNWSQWQVEQLKALEDYKRKNIKKFSEEFSTVNQRIRQALQDSYNDGGTKQERKILQAIKKGYKGTDTNKPAFTGNTSVTGEFFKTNDRKLDTLIKATTDDMQRAETAVLRMTNDRYRKIIFNAQVYANTGAGTYEKAVDMATKDFLSAGINCIEYKNGRRVNIKSYAEMALRTAGKRAYLQGEGNERKEWGVPTVILNKRTNPCPICAKFVGKVFIDDVWSDGSKDGISPVTGIKYPLLSEAIKQGLYHPNCKDSHTTYFEGISTPPENSQYTADELDEIAENYSNHQKAQHAQNEVERMERISKFSLDKNNQRIYSARAKQWREKAEEYEDKVHHIGEPEKNGSAANTENSIKNVANLNEDGIIKDNTIYHQFNSGNEANDFFYYDDDKRGLFAKKNSSHGKWVRTLSDDEKASVIDYAGGGYQDINNYWRKKGDWKQIDASQVEEESKQLDNAISRYELKDSIVVQRGAMEDVLDQLFENYETPDDYSGWIGKKYVEQGYMSTTVLNNNSIAMAKPVVFNIQVPAGQGVGAYINEPSLTGFCDTEYEFLIKRNSTFTITDVKENVETGEFIVDMRLDK